ncbi:unnamed protein product [Pieris macdunnoughi]|uniref:Uncharacterized protein n=1 Tax=Pieris macdunnoughi TaxID=345717 RepID=A0A821Y9Y1_9NEOP|nr:unnamed protein product [Pieris macdunnoughi]
MASLSRGGSAAGDPVDLLRSVLFYAQGVLRSGKAPLRSAPRVSEPRDAVNVSSDSPGSTTFKGETASAPSAATAPAPRPTSHRNKFSRESFEEMRQAAGLKSGDMTDPLNFLDPLWTLKKK